MPKAKNRKLVTKAHKSEQSAPVSTDTKTIVTVLLLIFAYPVGLILMWVWTNWPKWVKFVIMLPLILVMIAFISVVVLMAVNPRKAVQKAQCVEACKGNEKCESMCFDRGKYQYNTR